MEAEVAANRSNKKAALKRALTVSAKTVAGVTIATGSAYVLNKVFGGKGNPIMDSINDLKNAADLIKKAKGYMYF